MKRAPSRKGWLLLEVVVSVGLLAAVLAMVGRASVARAAHQRGLAERAAASLTIENAMERLSAGGYEGLDPETLPERAAAIDPRLVAQVEEVSRPVPARRVTLTLTPEGPRDVGGGLVLTAWFYPTETFQGSDAADSAGPTTEPAP